MRTKSMTKKEKDGIIDFLCYALSVNDAVKKVRENGNDINDLYESTALNDFLKVKDKEDKYIAELVLSAEKIYNITETPFLADTPEILVVDDDWEKKNVKLGSIVKVNDGSGMIYEIRDNEGNRVPFSYIDETGVVLEWVIKSISALVKDVKKA